MNVKDYKFILMRNEKVLGFLESAMIDEIQNVAEVFDGGMSLSDWEDLQEAIIQIKEERVK